MNNIRTYFARKYRLYGFLVCTYKNTLQYLLKSIFKKSTELTCFQRGSVRGGLKNVLRGMDAKNDDQADSCFNIKLFWVNFLSVYYYASSYRNFLNSYANLPVIYIFHDYQPLSKSKVYVSLCCHSQPNFTHRVVE